MEHYDIKASTEVSDRVNYKSAYKQFTWQLVKSFEFKEFTKK